MRFPNKNLSIQESMFSKFPLILTNIENNPIKLDILYNELQEHFESIIEFIDTITCLIVLEKISLDGNMIKECK